MIEIRTLEKLSFEELESFGFNGFKTDRIIAVEKSKEDKSMVIKFNEVELDRQYIKEWKSDNDSISFFQSIIDEGFSFGVFKDNVLIGILLSSYHGWNNSLWIENIRVSEKAMGEGIGRKLIDRLISYGKSKKIRILGLEVQSTNYPAIKFYEKCGFEISGVDFKRYPQRENDIFQVAIIMNIDIGERD
ncbi:MAG: GNAT family N-acetyltransferase [Firmicutes bacterium]|jgi:ribosomal protein S18 acetylase RimI-like enzyme|nr:GNAT family N-acetyltransferase [Bacillota bacterium]